MIVVQCNCQSCRKLTGAVSVSCLFDETEIEFGFTFSDTESLNDNSTFNFEIYKYNFDTLVFQTPNIYKSEDYPYTAFTSGFTEEIPIEDLNIDGDYLIKGYYTHDVCTDILGRLGLSEDTSSYKLGSEYGLYNSDKDFYFVILALFRYVYNG